jgi:hypothetical protein
MEWNTDVPTAAMSSRAPSPSDFRITASTSPRTAPGSRSGSIPRARTSSRTSASTAVTSMPATVGRDR